MEGAEYGFICHQISDLFYAGLISEELSDTMRKRLWEGVDRIFLTPVEWTREAQLDDPLQRQQRILFCLFMQLECEEEAVAVAVLRERSERSQCDS